MVRWNEVYSRFLTASEWTGKPGPYTITEVALEQMQGGSNPGQRKITIRLDDLEQLLVVNTTNAAILRDAFGDEAEDVMGQKIKVHVQSVRGPQGPTKGFRLEALKPTK